MIHRLDGQCEPTQSTKMRSWDLIGPSCCSSTQTQGSVEVQRRIQRKDDLLGTGVRRHGDEGEIGFGVVSDRLQESGELLDDLVVPGLVPSDSS